MTLNIEKILLCKYAVTPLCLAKWSIPFVIQFLVYSFRMLKTDLRKLWQLVRVILFDKVVSIKRLFAFHQYRHGALALRFTGGHFDRLQSRHSTMPHYFSSYSCEDFHVLNFCFAGNNWVISLFFNYSLMISDKVKMQNVNHKSDVSR